MDREDRELYSLAKDIERSQLEMLEAAKKGATVFLGLSIKDLSERGYVLYRDGRRFIEKLRKLEELSIVDVENCLDDFDRLGNQLLEEAKFFTKLLQKLEEGVKTSQELLEEKDFERVHRAFEEGKGIQELLRESEVKIEDIKHELRHTIENYFNSFEDQVRRRASSLKREESFTPRLDSHPIFETKIEKFLKCPNCGAKMPLEAKYCGICGAKIKQ